MPLPLILASSSPRRLDLLNQIGVGCEVVPADIDESRLPGESAVALVERLAVAKAQWVSKQHPNRVILAADTVVYLPGSPERIFGKPDGREDALNTLSQLSGRAHYVATGMALFNKASIQRKVVHTEVTFADISPAEQDAYWQSGESAGKAGAYAIQGIGAKFVVSIHGSYSNVVGLPLHETSVWLTQAQVNR